MIPVKTYVVIYHPPSFFFLLLTTAQFFKEFLASPDDKLCELLLDQNSFEITAGVQGSCQSKMYFKYPEDSDTSHFSGLFEVELLLGVVLFKIGRHMESCTVKTGGSLSNWHRIRPNSWLRSYLRIFSSSMCSSLVLLNP